jgi:diaminopimelate decarboxylase
MKRIDDALSVRNGHLYLEDCDTVELVERFGSPIFVVSEDHLRRTVRRFQTAFAAGWNAPVKVMPAVKANWNLAVQRILAEEGCGADIYSPGELSIALKAGFEPEFISVNGVPKSRSHVRRAVEVGARITIDSEEEVDFIEEAAAELGVVAKVRIRLRPVLSGFVERTDFSPEGPLPTDIAAGVYKGGLATEAAVRVARRVVATDGIDLVGFHQHHGRHHRSTAYWIAQMESFAAEIATICAAVDGFTPTELDIGGGFAMPRDPHNAATDYKAPYELAALYGISRVLNRVAPSRRHAAMSKLAEGIKSEPNTTPAPSIEEYASAATSTLHKALTDHGFDPDSMMLQLEPGRSLHGPAGIHLTTVEAIKSRTTPIPWNLVTVDTTEFFFTGGRIEHHLHDYRLANGADAPATQKADVIGRSCYGDRLLPSVPLPECEVGDVLALLDTGSYQEASASNFNAIPRPATVLVSGDHAEIIRRAETDDDVQARDIVPERLSNSTASDKESIR